MTGIRSARVVARLAAVLAAASLAACGTSESAVDYGNPAAEGAREREGLRLRVVAPASGATLREVEARLEVEVADLEGGAPRFGVFHEGVLIFDEALPASEGVVTVALPLLHGGNAFRLRVSSADGRRVLEQPWVVRRAGELPGLRVEGWRVADPETGACGEALAGPLSGALDVCVDGRVSSPGAEVTRVEARIGTDASHTAPDADGRFTLPVRLRADRMNRIGLRALDARGRASDTSTRLLHDGTPPTITLRSPADGHAETMESFWAIEGTLDDPSGLATVCFDLRDTPRACVPAASEFRWVTSLAQGTNRGAVIARDRLGNEAVQPFVIERVPAVRLRPPSEAPYRTALSLDRAGVEALFGEDVQRELVLARVPLRLALRSALARLQDPAGSGLDTSVWGQAEWNLFRLLTVTPDTADLGGTVFEEMTGVAEAIGLPTARVLAEMLGVGIEEPVLPSEVLVDVLLEQGIATHPNVVIDDDGESLVEVTLYDALRELEPLGERLGPSGPHPGFLAAPPRGAVLEPGFVFLVEAESRLRGYECVDTTRRSRDYLFLPPDDGPAIAFDFDDPATFSVLGLVAEPEVTFTFTVRESPVYHSAGTSREARPVAGRAGVARGDGSAWDEDPWLLESVIVEAAFRTFVERWREEGGAGSLRWSAGSIEEAASMTWAWGWITIRTAGDLGNPPPPVYVWDGLLEIAQIRLHDGGIPEGEAHVRFEVPNVPIGLDADALIDAMRPLLREQSDLLSDAILGDGRALASPCDFVLSEGGAALAQVAWEEVSPAGFFADAALTERVSSLTLDGVADTTWPKVRPTPGLVAWFRGRDGRAWRLEVLSVEADEVHVRVEAPDEPAEGE